MKARLNTALRPANRSVAAKESRRSALAQTPSEVVSTIVIGSGFSGLAMAAELNRQGIKAVVLESFCPTSATPTPTTGGIDLDALTERAEILRLLQHYARRHELDVRPHSVATKLLPRHTSANGQNHWSVQTSTGTVSAQTIVFTRVALNQIRRMLRNVGVTTGQEVSSVMHALGLYLVGVGEIALPSTQEILHQAKRAGQAISARIEAGLDAGNLAVASA